MKCRPSTRSADVRREAPRRHGRGFTLIEVVVAIAIVALGLAALFTVLANTAGNVSGLRERTFASWIAHNRIAEVRLATEFPSVDRTLGEVEYAGGKWRYAQVVSQTAVDGLRRIDVSVGPKTDAGGRMLADTDAYSITVSGFVGKAQQASPPSTAGWSGQATVPGGEAPPPQQASPPSTLPPRPTPIDISP